MREATIEVGVSIPDYVTNQDVYKAANEAAEKLEMSHVDVHDMNIFGLEYESQEGSPSA